MTTTWMDVNLLPPESVTKRYAFSLGAVSIGALSVATLTCAVLGWTAHQSKENSASMEIPVQSQVQSASTEISTLQRQLSQVQSAKQLLQHFGPLFSVDGALEALLGAAPAGILVQSMGLTGDVVTLSGQANQVEDVANYQDKVSRLPMVLRCWVNTMNQSDKQILFTMEITLKGGAL